MVPLDSPLLHCGERGIPSPHPMPMAASSYNLWRKAAMVINRTMRHWIRVGSVTTYAKKNELSELFDKFNAVPYDDRVNRLATIDDIRRGYVEDFLLFFIMQPILSSKVTILYDQKESLQF
jgi:hypothetical protein